MLIALRCIHTALHTYVNGQDCVTTLAPPWQAQDAKAQKGETKQIRCEQQLLARPISLPYRGLFNILIHTYGLSDIKY